MNAYILTAGKELSNGERQEAVRGLDNKVIDDRADQGEDFIASSACLSRSQIHISPASRMPSKRRGKAWVLYQQVSPNYVSSITRTEAADIPAFWNQQLVIKGLD